MDMNSKETGLPSSIHTYSGVEDEGDDNVWEVSSSASSFKIIYTPQASDVEDGEGWEDAGPDLVITQEDLHSLDDVPGTSAPSPGQIKRTSSSSEKNPIITTPPPDVSSFLNEKVTAAFNSGRLSEAVTLLQVLIRENDSKGVEAPADIRIMLADAYAVMSRTPELYPSSLGAEVSRKKLFSDAKAQLEKAEEHSELRRLQKVKINVKLCTLAIAGGDYEHAEQLINIAGMFMDKHQSIMKKEENPEGTIRKRKGKVTKEEEQEEELQDEDTQHLRTEIRTIRAMLLSHEDDGYGFRTQNILGPLLSDPVNVVLVSEILEGFGYELVADRHMPAKYIICPKDEDAARKLRRRRIFGENYQEEAQEMANTIVMLVAVVIFGISLFPLGFNMFYHVMQDPGVVAAKAAAGVMVVGAFVFIQL